MQRTKVIVTGVILGLLGVLLVKLGNPPNMGFCVACFLRDITGALGLHRTATVQYLRPEILGVIIGAFLSALASREFRSLGGSNPFTRFTLACAGMIGMMIFLGCPVRTILRLAAGDLNALVGLVGLMVGVGIGAWFISQGFTLGRAVPQSKISGLIITILVAGLVVAVFSKPAFIFASQQGPGSLHAPVLLSLLAGIIVGIFAQRSRFCMVGGIRDFILVRDTYLLSGLIAMLLTALIANLVLGSFKLGFTGQPIAHSDGLWNFLGMALAGWAAVLLGGCPLRQLVAAGEGNTDCAVTIFGFITGAALAHNFGLAASPAGIPAAGKVAVVVAFIFVLVLSLFNTALLAQRGVNTSAERS